MSGFLILLFIVVAIFNYLLFAPFYLEINSVNGLFRFRFHRLASINLKVIDASLIAEIKIAVWKKQIDLFSIGKVSKEVPVVKSLERRKVRKGIPWEKIKGVIASFKINKCNILIDSGDMRLNGILYPAFYLLSVYSEKNIEINFINKNVIIFEVENNLARMSWAYISS